MILKLLLNTPLIRMIFVKFQEYNPNRKRKTLIVFDDMVADMHSNKNFNPRVTELFIRGRHFSCVYYTMLFYSCAKYYRTDFYSLFYYENSKQHEVHQILLNHSSDIAIKGFYESLQKFHGKTIFFSSYSLLFQKESFR